MSSIPPIPLPENGEESPKKDTRTWERWIKGIGFGIYILAALGILFYAVIFRNFGWNWADLRPFVFGIIALAVILFLISYGQSSLNTAPISVHAKKLLATITLTLFVFIIAVVVVWAVIFILKDAGIIPTSDDTQMEEYKAVVGNAHETNIAMIDRSMHRIPEKTDDLRELKEDLTRAKDQIIVSVDEGKLTSTSILRPTYNQLLNKYKLINPSAEPQYLLHFPGTKKSGG